MITISEIVEKIKERANKGKYIYRGEPECYKKISSGLYRHLASRGGRPPSPSVIRENQNRILEGAKEYLHGDDDFKTLGFIQHHGGMTNLIDFTSDPFIALFFACESSHRKDGRVIVLKEKCTEDYEIREMLGTIKRARDQKSIFVQAHKGFIEVEEANTICIPSNLKRDLIAYLETDHDISTKSVFDDIHGFIQSTDQFITLHTISSEELQELLEGLYQLSQFYCKIGEYDQAINEYSEAIELLPKNAELYAGRAAVYAINENQMALNDYDTAIELDPEKPMYYYERCLIFILQQKSNEAKKDYTIIKNMDGNFDDLLKELKVKAQVYSIELE